MEPAELIGRALHEPDPALRAEAARGLSGQPQEALAPLLPLLSAALREVAPLVQRRAANMLGLLGPRAAPAIPALLEALRSRRWTVREAAAQALGHVSVETATGRAELAQAVLHDRQPLVRESAAVALERLGPDSAREELRPGLQHRHPRVRCRALRALALPGLFDPALVPDFTRALADSDLRVRAVAAESLGAQGVSALPALGLLVRRCADRNVRAASAARGAVQAVLPAASPWLRGWVGRLVPPADVLEVASGPDLPEPVARAFGEVCRRRAALLHARSDSAERGWLAGWLVRELQRWEAAAPAPPG